MRDEMGFSPLEILGLVHGAKPASRIPVRPEAPQFESEFEKFKEKCEKLGLFWRLKSYEKFLYTNQNKTILYVSRNPRTIDKLIDAESIPDTRKIGQIFNFPKCCVDFYCGRNREKMRPFPLEIYFNSRKPFSFYNNFLYYTFTYFLPSNSIEDQCLNRIKRGCNYFIYHLPCSFNCKESSRAGKKYQAILKKEMPEFAERVETVLKKRVVFFGNLDFVLLNNASEGEDECEALYESVFGFPSITPKEIIEKIAQGNRIKTGNRQFEVFRNNEKIFETKRDAKIFWFE